MTWAEEGIGFRGLAVSSGHAGSPLRNEQDAAADHAGFALLVDETGVAGRAAVTNVEPNMAGFDPTDDVRELNRVASDAEEDHGRVALGELTAGRGG